MDADNRQVTNYQVDANNRQMTNYQVDTGTDKKQTTEWMLITDK